MSSQLTMPKECVTHSESATVHHVKSWMRLFGPTAAGKKTHELRYNDRNYKVGDILDLQEYDQEIKKYTGRSTKVEITYMTSAENPCAMSSVGLNEGFVILSVKKV
jgi:hypothetical protein